MNKQYINEKNISDMTLKINDPNDSILSDIIQYLEDYHYNHLCCDGPHKCGCSSIDMMESAAYHFGILEKIQELESKNKEYINEKNIRYKALKINDPNDPILSDVIHYLEHYHYDHLCRDGPRNCGCSSIDMMESAAYHFGILEKIQELKHEKKYNNDTDTKTLINLMKNCKII
jgi:hypothetical protein